MPRESDLKLKPGSWKSKLFAGILAFAAFGLFYRMWIAAIAALVAVVLAAGSSPSYGAVICKPRSDGAVVCDVDACTKAKQIEWVIVHRGDRPLVEPAVKQRIMACTCDGLVQDQIKTAKLITKIKPHGTEAGNAWADVLKMGRLCEDAKKLHLRP